MGMWGGYPFLLVRRACLLLLSGMACAAVGLVSFLAFGDRVLLGLSMAVFMGSLGKGAMLWQLVKRGKYEVVEGVCVGILAPAFRRYKKIKIMDGDAIEGSILLPNQARVRIGHRYRFFFKEEPGHIMGEGNLAALLASGLFLGYEALGEYGGSGADK